MWLPATDNHLEAHNNVIKKRIASCGQQALRRMVNDLSGYLEEVSTCQDPSSPSFDRAYADLTRAPTTACWGAAEKAKLMRRLDISTRNAILFVESQLTLSDQDVVKMAITMIECTYASIPAAIRIHSIARLVRHDGACNRFYHILYMA